MSREIVIRDVYAALMGDDDWDGTTSASVDEVLSMYGYGPENPGHGIIGQISDVLYTAEEWNRATTNAIALTLAEDSDRRRLEALGPMVRNGSPLASDALMDHLEENPPRGGMIEFEEEDYEENPSLYRTRRGRKKSGYTGVEFDTIQAGDSLEILFEGRTRFGTAIKQLESGNWFIGMSDWGERLVATPENTIAIERRLETPKQKRARSARAKREAEQGFTREEIEHEVKRSRGGERTRARNVPRVLSQEERRRIAKLRAQHGPYAQIGDDEDIEPVGYTEEEDESRR